LPISSWREEKSGISSRSAAHADGGGRQPPQRIGDRRGKEQRKNDVDECCDAEDADDGKALGVDDLVDIACLGGEQQHAEYGTETLHRDRHGNDQLALFGDTHDRTAHAGERVHHLRIDRPVAARRFLVKRQIARLQQPVEPGADRLRDARRFRIDRRQIEAKHLAAAVEMARVEQEVGIGVEEARARTCRRDQSSQNGRDTFLDDRKFQILVTRERRDAFAGLQLEQLFRIDGDRVGIHRCRSRDGAGDDFALRQQAFHAGVDEAFAELVEIHDPADEDDERDEVEEDDAPRETRKDGVAEQASDQRKGMCPSALATQRGGPPISIFDIALQDFYQVFRSHDEIFVASFLCNGPSCAAACRSACRCLAMPFARRHQLGPIGAGRSLRIGAGRVICDHPKLVPCRLRSASCLCAASQ
jgi:hypothetical protein